MQVLKQDISKLISVKTYADLNKVSVTEVYRRIKAGKVKSVRIDKTHFIEN